MKLFKTSLVTFFLTSVFVCGFITLVYYGFMKADGKGDEAKETIRQTASSAVPDDIKNVSKKLKSGVSHLSDILIENYSKHVRTHKNAHPA